MSSEIIGAMSSEFIALMNNHFLRSNRYVIFAVITP